MNILVKFPTRSRPEKFINTLNKYYETCKDLSKIYFVVTCDNDDLTMNNPKMIERVSNYKNCSIIFGNSKSKIDAVNRDMSLIQGKWDVLLLASDDMIPKVIGWDDIIRQKMIECYPDTDGILWFYDNHRRDLNTLVIEGRKYFERFGYIYNPQYESLYADDEFTAIGNILGKMTFFEDVIIEHEHPHFTGEQYDPLMFRNESHNLRHKDANVFEENKRNQFNLYQKQ